MALPNIFSKEESNKMISRLNGLNNDTQALWGKMNVSQMLAHCNVTYEMCYESKHTPATGIKKFLLTMLVKPTVVGTKAYKKNSQTAPEFKISDNKDFKLEKERLITYIEKTNQLGESYFEGKESNSFGKLNATEWNNMFYKHLDHHLSQFGV